MKLWRIGPKIVEETKHPIWGDLFKRVLTSELTADDIYFADSIGRPCPQWIAIIAGANARSITTLSDFIITDFIIDVMMEYEAIDNLEDAMHAMTHGKGEPWDNVRLN